MEQRVSTQTAQENLGQIVDELLTRGGNYVIERSGTPVAAIIPMETYERLQKDNRRIRDLINQFREGVVDVDPLELDEAIQEAVEAAKAAERGQGF